MSFVSQFGHQCILSFLLQLSLVGAALAETCTINVVCEESANCARSALTLRWTPETSETIEIDGKVMRASWINEPQITDTMRVGDVDYQIVAPGPQLFAYGDRRMIVIVPGDAPGHISASTLQTPRRFVDYEDAVSNRAVFKGLCEGLF
ncbi:MAG: hypothetical protein AAF801_08445 [Pseudomonadota bacterium]